MRTFSPRLWWGLFLLSLVVLASAVDAAPYRPTDDAQVLEQLPAGLRASMSRARASSGRNDPTIAVALARRYIERSRHEADPRFLGYAQGVLAPWWTSTQAPAELLLLRATIKQARHEFQPALDDLDLALQQKPDFAQAWLTQAVVLRVLGRFDAAAQTCLRLEGIPDAVVAGLCHWSVEGSRGQLVAAYAGLLDLSQHPAAQDPEMAAWLAAELGDMAERLGQPAAAEAHYRAGLDRSPDDFGLRAAYADLLLDLQRPREVLRLTEGLDHVDAMRLRRALALHQLADPAFEDLNAQIEAGFANAHLRNEELHLREESRYALQARGDAVRALRLAQINWDIQREPRDARILIEAARAAAKPDAAWPALEFIRSSGLQDARLNDALSAGTP